MNFIHDRQQGYFKFTKINKAAYHHPFDLKEDSSFRVLLGKKSIFTLVGAYPMFKKDFAVWAQEASMVAIKQSQSQYCCHFASYFSFLCYCYFGYFIINLNHFKMALSDSRTMVIIHQHYLPSDTIKAIERCCWERSYQFGFRTVKSQIDLLKACFEITCQAREFSYRKENYQILPMLIRSFSSQSHHQCLINSWCYEENQYQDPIIF